VESRRVIDVVVGGCIDCLTHPVTHPRKPCQRKVETSPRMGPVDHEESGDEGVDSP